MMTLTSFMISDDVEKDLYEPAVNGTVGILKSIKTHAPTVQRVVVVSSFASIVTSAKGAWPGHHYTADDWNPVRMTSITLFQFSYVAS